MKTSPEDNIQKDKRPFRQASSSIKKNFQEKTASYYFPHVSLLNTFLFIILIIIMSISFFYSHSLRNAVENQRYLQTLTALQYENAILDQHIVQTHQSYQYHFDKVFTHVEQLEKKAKKLQNLPTFLSIAAKTTLEEKRLHYFFSLEDKKKIIQQLKEGRTFIKHSLSTFSEEVERCNTILLKEKKIKEANKINTLFHSILLYNTPTQHITYDSIQQQIATLKNVNNASFSNKTELEHYWNVIRLAQNIAKKRNEIDFSMQTLFELFAVKDLQDIYDLYMNEHNTVIKKKIFYRTIFNWCVVFLIILSGITLYALSQNESVVKKVNTNLDSIVAKRVDELNQRHKELNEYITELCNIQERFEKSSVIDELTGLYTRHFLFEWLQKQISLITRTQESFCCMMVDIDNFRGVNESHGYLAGDKILKKVATLLKYQVREDDIVCRYGGEEFIIFLSQSNFELAKPVAERIRRSIADDIVKPAKITVSIGLAACQCKTEYRGKLDFRTIMRDLIERADLALFEAKENGRNQISICDDMIELV